jgi:hypothetical protein
VAKKMIRVSDMSGEEITDGKGALFASRSPTLESECANLI